jgi:ribosomal protein S18 acetylase RimI-like enzyme
MNSIKVSPYERNWEYPKMALSFSLLSGFLELLPVRSKFQVDFILFRKELFPGVWEEEFSANGLVFRQARKSDLQQIKDNPERPLTEVYMNRLVDGHGIFCAVKDEEVVSFVWYNFQELCSSFGSPYQVFMGKLEKNSAYLYDLYTFKKFRGQRIAESLLKYVSAFFSNSGIVYLNACVSPANLPSVLLFRKLGFVPADLIHLYRIEGMKKCFRGTKHELKTVQQWIA